MTKKKKKYILVRCTFEIPVEVEDSKEYEDLMSFDIEENHCPGTGLVGHAFDEIYKYNNTGHCWACAMKGKNEIIDRNYICSKN